MRYISGTYALNVKDDVFNTPGDWHASALDWSSPPTGDTEDSVFGDWGLRTSTHIPDNPPMPAATHLRACLDLIAAGYFSSAQGMREGFLSDERLTPLVFEKVALLKDQRNGEGIDAFMGREYLCDWLNFKEGGRAVDRDRHRCVVEGVLEQLSIEAPAKTL